MIFIDGLLRANREGAGTPFPLFSGFILKHVRNGMQLTITALFAASVLPCLSVAGSAPDSARAAELMYLLRHDCGSCHGMTRKGGLGPSLLPEDLRGRPVQLLVNTVLDGRAGTPMPPWRGQLSPQEAGWLVETLLTGKGL